MKKTISMLALIVIFNLSSSEYKLTINKLHYKNSIFIKQKSVAEEINIEGLNKNHIELGSVATSNSQYSSAFTSQYAINGILDNYPDVSDNFAWNLNGGITETVMRNQYLDITFNKEYRISKIGINSRTYRTDVNVKEYKFIFSDGTEKIIEFDSAEKGIMKFSFINNTPFSDTIRVIPWSMHPLSPTQHMLIGEISFNIIE